MNNSGSVTVGHGEVDLGWCKISGYKEVCLAQPSSVILAYELNCCAIQITRDAKDVAWSAFSKDARGLLDHRGGGVKPIADTSLYEIKRAAVEAVFGASFVAEHVIEVIRQCDEQHAKQGAAGWPDSIKRLWSSGLIQCAWM